MDNNPTNEYNIAIFKIAWLLTNRILPTSISLICSASDGRVFSTIIESAEHTAYTIPIITSCEIIFFFNRKIEKIKEPRMANPSENK